MSNTLSPSNPFDTLNEYESRHLLEHLAACGRTSEVHTILALETDDGRNAWYLCRTHTGTDADFQRDIDLAVDLIDTAINPNESSLILKTRYRIVSSSLSAIHDRFPPRVISQLIRVGVWSARQAIEAIEFLSDGTQRAEMIEEVLAYIPTEYRARLTEISQTLPATTREISEEPIDYPSIIVTSVKAEILARLSGMFDGSEAERLGVAAIEAALKINNRRDRARSLGNLLPHLPHSQQQTAAAHILPIADTQTNPERAFLTLPVLKHLPQNTDDILPRIQALTDASFSHYRKQTLRYLNQVYAALSKCSQAVIREALTVAAERAYKRTGKGLLASLTAGGIDPSLIREAASRCPRRMSKDHEREWIPLFVCLAQSGIDNTLDRLASLRYVDNQIEYYLRVRQFLNPSQDDNFATAFMEQIAKVGALEERVRLAAGLLATGALSRPKARRLSADAAEYSATIRNPPPRLAALWCLIDADPSNTRAIELTVSTIPLLSDKPRQADAWVNLASRIHLSPAIADHHPWKKAVEIVRKISPQKDRARLLVRLFALDPASCFSILAQDLLGLEANFRVRTLVRTMPHFNTAQKERAVRMITDIIHRTGDPKKQWSMLSISAECLNIAALSDLANVFRSLSDETVQYGCLAKIASCAPKTLIQKYLEFLFGKPRLIRTVDTAIAPIADWLTPHQARLAYEMAGRGTLPLAQAKTFQLLSPKLPEADHLLALQRALRVKQRVVKSSALATVVEALDSDVLNHFHTQINGALPSAPKALYDHSGDPLFFSLSRTFARKGNMLEAFRYLAMSRSQEEHLIGLSKHIAMDDIAFDHILEVTRSIFNLEGRARIQLALLVWRAKLVSTEDAFAVLRTLDSHCMPFVLAGLAPWLNERQIRQLLKSVRVSPGTRTPAPPAQHIWTDDDQASIGTFSTVTTGYFARTPSGPPSASTVVAALLPRLVDLGFEEEAWEFLHYAAREADLLHFITASAPRLSNSGLGRAVDYARSLNSRTGWIAALASLAIEFAQRGNFDDAQRLIALLPKRSPETTDFHRHRNAGEIIRAQLRMRLPASDLLPEELIEEMAPCDLANHPSLAVSVVCLANLPADKAIHMVDDLFLQMNNSGSRELEVAAIEYLVRRAATLPIRTLRHVVDYALGIRGFNPSARRPRGNVLAIIERLAPAIQRLETEQSLVALYSTVQQVCGWWA